MWRALADGRGVPKVLSLGVLMPALQVIPPAQQVSPTSAVVFHRSESEVTRVVVGRPSGELPRVSPRLFSNFLEHLGGSIYEALWANVVYNPQFEADRNGTLARWALHGAVWLEEGLVGRSLRLTEGDLAIQQVALPVHRERRYRGTVWIRSLSSKAPVLVVSLRKKDGSEVAVARVRAGGSRWLPRRLDMRIPQGAVARAELLDLVLTAETGTLDVDMLEIFPADAVHGVDPEVVQIAKSLKIELLRWPGGNFVSGYHWQNGIGPRELRPTVPNPAWSGLETHHFGTDEFMAFCARIGAKPHICVNAGNGTPAEAAAWVEYCNGDVTTPMGARRAANGHPEPYNVRVWEVGNELYGSWQIGHTGAAGNARRFLEFRKAMLAADPSIEVIATGKGDQFAGEGLEFDRQWNTAVLDAAREDGRPPHHLSLHPLVPLPSGLHAQHSYADIFASAMAHPLWWSQEFVPQLQRLLEERGGSPVPKAAVTEWGIIVGGREWREFPNHDDHSGAVYAGLFFHALMRAAAIVDIANVTALMHGGCIRKHRGVVYVTPMIHVQRMYGQAMPERLLPIEVSGPAYDVPRRRFLPAVRDVPWVDVVVGEAKGRWVACMVNRDAERGREVELELPWPVRDAQAEILAADLRATNDLEQPDRVAPRIESLTANGRSLRLQLPAAAVCVVTLRMKR